MSTASKTSEFVFACTKRVSQLSPKQLFIFGLLRVLVIYVTLEYSRRLVMYVAVWCILVIPVFVLAACVILLGDNISLSLQFGSPSS